MGASRDSGRIVSANPTGPLHVGHGRGAALVPALQTCWRLRVITHPRVLCERRRASDGYPGASPGCAILSWNSITTPFPGNAYQGEYVHDMARLIHQVHAERYVHSGLNCFLKASAEAAGEARLKRLSPTQKKLLGQDYTYHYVYFVLSEQLGDCRNDLMRIWGCLFDVWFSSNRCFSMAERGRARSILLETTRFMCTSQDGAKWFESFDFGDEKDRVVQRENGQFTYLSSDIVLSSRQVRARFSSG